MPTIIKLLGYTIYIWTNDHEPVHVHVAKGKPTENATKIVVPALEAVFIENNNSNIPNKDLKRIVKWISQNKADIRLQWDIIKEQKSR